MKLSFWGWGPTGTDRCDKKAEEDGESKDKFVANGERLYFVSAPLEVDRDGEDDEEDPEKESLENETNQGRRRQGDHLQQGGTGRTSRSPYSQVGDLYVCRVSGSDRERSHLPWGESRSSLSPEDWIFESKDWSVTRRLSLMRTATALGGPGQSDSRGQ